MKNNKIIIILVTIILVLLGYIIYDKFLNNNINQDYNLLEEDEIKIIDKIELEYVKIYLTNEKYAIISPINMEDINKLNIGKNLKDRLLTLYNKSFYQDIYVNNYKIKGYKVELDNEIKSINKIVIDDYIYVIFLKENNTIGLFNYDEYYNLLNTSVIDNYNNYKNILNIKNNKIIYLDGSEVNLEVIN